MRNSWVFLEPPSLPFFSTAYPMVMKLGTNIDKHKKNKMVKKISIMADSFCWTQKLRKYANFGKNTYKSFKLTLRK